MSELEERIIGFVAQQTGIKAKHILLSSSLAQEIGMDGDDAVEFFQSFGRDFNVDLDGLWRHWDRHFGPEVGGPSFGFLVLIVPAVMLGDLLHRAFQRVPAWAWMIVLYVVFARLYTRFFTDRDHEGVLPVTVADLVEAANAGKWVKVYEEGAVMFRTL